MTDVIVAGSATQDPPLADVAEVAAEVTEAVSSAFEQGARLGEDVARREEYADEGLRAELAEVRAELADLRNTVAGAAVVAQVAAEVAVEAAETVADAVDETGESEDQADGPKPPEPREGGEGGGGETDSTPERRGFGSRLWYGDRRA